MGSPIPPIDLAFRAIAKPDLGILIVRIRSFSPIADEAVAGNGRKAKPKETGHRRARSQNLPDHLTQPLPLGTFQRETPNEPGLLP
jgi:hypothetical protein